MRWGVNIMNISQRIFIDIEKEKTANGYRVNLLRSSTILINGQPQSNAKPTIFGTKDFSTEAEADMEVDRLKNHFVNYQVPL